MTDPTLAEKAALRQAMKAMRKAILPGGQTEAAQALARHASALAALRAPGIVSGYIPIRGEIDPGPLMAALAAAGWQLALPRIEGEELSFRAHRPGDVLACGGFGLTEPQADAPRVTPAMILVPLLAFDRRGHRLGYGRGYYDRALRRMAGAVTIGLGHCGQEVPRVPVQAHDVSLDFIATDGELVDCRR